MVGPVTKPDGQLTRRALGRAGIALPAAITALAALSVLIAGVWVIVDLNAKTSLNRRSAMSALMVAEAGASHALGLTRGKLKNIKFDQFLKGADNQWITSTDNGLLINYAGLTAAEQIPAGGVPYGGGRYFVTLVDDPADPNADPMVDGNDKVLARCRGVMPDGATAEIQAVIGYFVYPALASEGNLKFRGNATIKGACGGIHANQVVEVTGTSTRVDGPITASDTVKAGACQIMKTDGVTCNVPLHHQPPVDIPTLTMADMCYNPDRYVLRADGWVVKYVAGVPLGTYDATSSSQFGWSYSISGGKVLWSKAGGGGTTDGTFCVEGNVRVEGGGTDADPWDVSIFATGSVEFAGNPKVVASDTSGALVVAEGDVKFAGQASISQENFGGLIYAGAQCTGSGTPRINGQLICKDGSNPPGSTNIVNYGDSELTADIGGQIEITFGCGGMFSKRKILTWMQKLGS